MKEISNKMIMISSFFIFIYVGAEVGFGGWIPTYTVLKNLRTAEESGVGSSLFWTFLTFGRFIGIFLTRKYTSTRLMTINIIGANISCLYMILSDGSINVVYYGSCFYGFFMSTMYPLI